MPTATERLALLMEAHGDSYRGAAEICGVDHTTLMRVARGDTENPATLAKIAEGYGVPLSWMRGDKDLATDFSFAVLSRPLQERVLFLRDRERRVAYALTFLRQYDPGRFTCRRLGELLRLQESDVESMLARERGHVATENLERLCSTSGLPIDWFRTGLVGREDEEELLTGLAEMTLASIARSVGLEVPADEIRAAAEALV